MKHPREYLHCTTRMVDVPVRLHWSYGGKSGVADRSAIAMIDNETGWFCLSDYWWFEGNGGCDCNRADFCKLSPEEFPALYQDGPAGSDTKCGHDIFLTRIESLDPLIPSLDGEDAAD